MGPPLVSILGLVLASGPNAIDRRRPRLISPFRAAPYALSGRPMSDFNTQLAGVVNTFVAQVSALARQAAIETLGTALGGSLAAPAPRRATRVAAPAVTPSRPATTATPAPTRRALPKGAKRPAEQLEGLRVTLLEFVKANPGQRIEQINKALGVSTKDLSLPVRKLIETGDIRAEGAKRSTKYFPAKGKKS
jgi:enoyl-CoA hydratase/carnithine racemase